MSVGFYGTIQSVGDDAQPLSPSFEQSPLSRFVQHRLIDGTPAAENKCRQVGRRTLEGGSVVMGSAGTIPFIPISLKLAGNHRAYGIALAAGNMGSFSALNSWSLLKIIDSEMSPLTTEEQELVELDNKYSCVKTTMKVTAFAIGSLSQVPLSYMAYVYNDHNVAFAILMLISDSGVPIYSLLLTTDEVQNRISRDATERKLFLTKQNLIEQLYDNEQALIEVGAEERGAYLLSLAQMQDATNEEKISDMLGKLFRPLRPREKENCFRNTGKYIARGGGVILAGARLFLSGVLGYKAMELFTDSPTACYSSGIVIVACSSYLTLQAMTKTAVRTYDAALNILTCSIKPNLAYQLNPKLTAALCLVGLGFTALSYGPSVQVCRDNFSGKTENAMEVLVPTGTVLMVVYAMGDLVNDVVLSYSGKWGTAEAKLLVDLHNKMQRFSRVLRRSPLLEHAKFLKVLPDDCLQLCLEKALMTTDELDSYISTRTSLLNHKRNSSST